MRLAKLGEEMQPTETQACLCMKGVAFTDGACSGMGGWGLLLECGEHMLEHSGRLRLVINSQVELTAVQEALAAINRPCELTVVTDSSNIIGWLSFEWKRKHEGVCALC